MDTAQRGSFWERAAVTHPEFQRLTHYLKTLGKLPGSKGFTNKSRETKTQETYQKAFYQAKKTHRKHKTRKEKTHTEQEAKK